MERFPTAGRREGMDYPVQEPCKTVEHPGRSVIAPVQQLPGKTKIAFFRLYLFRRRCVMGYVMAPFPSFPDSFVHTSCKAYCYATERHGYQKSPAKKDRRTSKPCHEKKNLQMDAQIAGFSTFLSYSHSIVPKTSSRHEQSFSLCINISALRNRCNFCLSVG